MGGECARPCSDERVFAMRGLHAYFFLKIRKSGRFISLIPLHFLKLEEQFLHVSSGKESWEDR